MTPTRGALICGAAFMLAAAGAALAQTNYPAKPVRWIVPYPPVGGTDILSRAVAQKLTEA